jgi:hypothetical protein
MKALGMPERSLWSWQLQEHGMKGLGRAAASLQTLKIIDEQSLTSASDHRTYKGTATLRLGKRVGQVCDLSRGELVIVHRSAENHHGNRCQA